MSQESMRTQAGIIPTQVTTVTAAATVGAPTAVSSVTVSTGQKEFFRAMEDTVTRITKEQIFGFQQFVMSDKVMDINGGLYKHVMKEAKKDPDDTGMQTYWLIGGRKVVEKTINRQRQAVVLRVKKRFAGTLYYYGLIEVDRDSEWVLY